MAQIAPSGRPVAAVLESLAALETKHREVTFETLRRSVLSGEGKAWDRFVEKYSRFVYAVAMKSLAGLSEREEAASAIYLHVFERLAARDFSLLRRFEGRCRFTTYLYRVVLSARKDHFARRSVPAIPLDASDQGDSSEPADPSPPPVPTLQAEALRRAVRDAVGGLDARDRLFLLWRFRDGLKLREIAVIAGLKDTNAAAWALRQAIEQLGSLRRLSEDRRFGEAEIDSMEKALREELLDGATA